MMTRWPAWLADLGLLKVQAGLAGILMVAMVLQYAGGEVPCPLCLLERVAMLGTALAVGGWFRTGRSPRAIGHALVWALTLLVISVRQVLLDIAPRAGHSYIGSPVLGLHMPVWSVVIAAALILWLALILALFDADRLRTDPIAPAFARAARWIGIALVAIAAINLVSALLQCGFGQCHTSGYKWL